MYLTYEQVKKLKFVEGNRKVDPKHVKELLIDKHLVKNGMWHQLEAVVINRFTNGIMNGQHRTTGYLWCIENGIIPRDTKLKVSYEEISEEDELQDIDDMNGGKNWNTNTRIESKASKGNEDYVKLLEFCETHPLCNNSYRTAVAMMTGKRFDFNKNPYVYSPKQAELGDKIHDELAAILNILELKRGAAGIEGMAMSWYDYRTDHSFSEWKAAIRSNKKMAAQFSTRGKESWNQYFGFVSNKIDRKNKKAAQGEF